MLLLNFVPCIIILLNTCIALATKCTPFQYNTGNFESNVENLKTLLEPFTSSWPIYNNTTVPSSGKLIEQFQKGKADPDVHLNFTQLVTKYGYPVEQHQVITEDQYCLTLFRIPRPNAPVVFLMHGVLCSSDDWITIGQEKGLAYTLYDAGYDVWLGNARGNKHSRCNLHLSPDCAEFWKFSFEEIGLYDIPAMIDYALENTGKSKLLYVGHSQGTTSFYVMTSMRPEYNDKIAFMVCLSAVVFMSHVRSPLIQLISPFENDVEALAELVGGYEVAPRDAFIDALTSTFCGSPELAELFCESIIYVLSGFNYPQLNASVLPVIYSHYPAGSSIYQLVHYAQETNSGKFGRFDYGVTGNLAKYNAIVPPNYPLDKVRCPMAIFYSNNDWLTSAPDIVTFLKQLPNVIEFYHVPCASFMHFDYIFGKDSDVLVNKEILSLLAKYKNDS
ncbi:lipase 3-like [Amyelois transitella]|uniref:lipase 3-like n=1 Tax=Amyelois transitella TaxID=680683 RepID=UPI00298F5F1D|nr:lipase 3-like [Amyelois transitella]